MNIDHLNEKQQEAVRTTEGSVLVIAGAGSGKTSTMTTRIGYLMEKGVSPYNILAVTFTNKAAGEMKSRVADLVGDVRNMWILTFHAMCLRMLHVNFDKVGYEKNFVIYDTADQKTLIKKILKDMNLDPKKFVPAEILGAISKCKEKGMRLSEARELLEESMYDSRKVNVALEYEKRLLENNAMDFDDLLLNTFILLRDFRDIREEYQNRFRYIMVDEYQDTNHIQYRIVRFLAEANGNICVVGDDDQCIYQWRGADIRNILEFEKDFPNTKVIKLEQNYRSVGNILDGAHSVITHNRGRKKKKLWTTKEAGDKIQYFQAGWDKEEADYVADKIQIEQSKGEMYKDMAILYRTNSQSRLFESALSSRGIPYKVLSGLRYYDRKEIKDILCYMRLVVNPVDNLALERIINEPKRGIGAKTLEKIRAFADITSMGMLEALGYDQVLSNIPSKSREPLTRLVSLLEGLHEERFTKSTSDIYDELLTETGYLKALEDEDTGEAEDRIENLMDFKSVILDFESSAEEDGLVAIVQSLREGEDQEENQGENQGQSQVAPIDAFMENLALAAEVDKHDESEDAVVLMTMHSAKGLEFDIVFMPGMEDGLFPGSRSYDDVSKMEEERRLCYVGMTRAKKRLYMTSAQSRMRYGRTETMRESKFLKEIDSKLIEGSLSSPRNMRNEFDDFGANDESPFIEMGGFGSYGNTSIYESELHGRSNHGESRRSYGTRYSETPYDSLQSSIARTKSKMKKIKETFNIGDVVRHKTFGEGTVIEASTGRVTVMFEKVGIKKIALVSGVITKV